LILCIFCLLPSIGLGLFAIFDDDEDNGSCVSPIDEKYDFSNASGSYKIDSFKITGIECKDGYSGSVTVTKCNASGSPYNVSGCTLDSKCTSTFPDPTDNTYTLIEGEEITNYAINSLKTLNSEKICSGTGDNVSCNWDINASGVISCNVPPSASGTIFCNSSGIFELRNCSGVHATDEDPEADGAAHGAADTQSSEDGEDSGETITVSAPAVDCAGHYGDWGACSATCAGTQTRSFVVDTAAENGGAACPTDTESQACSTENQCWANSTNPYIAWIDETNGNTYFAVPAKDTTTTGGGEWQFSNGPDGPWHNLDCNSFCDAAGVLVDLSPGGFVFDGNHYTKYIKNAEAAAPLGYGWGTNSPSTYLHRYNDPTLGTISVDADGTDTGNGEVADRANNAIINLIPNSRI
jgi:hypothetical protein